MSLVKRPGSSIWSFSIYRGPDKPRLRGTTGKTDKGEAEAVERVIRLAHAGKTPRDRLVAMIDALTGSQRIGLVLRDAWGVYDSWRNSVGKGLAEITIRQRRRAVERFTEWAAEHWPSVCHAGEVDRACAAGFAAWLAKQGGGGKARRNLIGDLGTVWEGLRHVRDDVTFNPWPLVLPADDSERGKAFNIAQERSVLRAADGAGHGWGLACRLARHTGLRYGDVARLKWSAVDLANRVIRIAPSKTSRHGVQVTLPLCDALGAALADAAALAGQETYVLPEHAACYPDPYKGTPGAFAVVLAAAHIPSDEYDFHSWRHTFRTRLSEAGVSDEIAKRLGGWTVDKTAMRYDHDGRIEELRAAVQRGSGVGLQESK